ERREQQLDDLGHLKLPLWRFHHVPSWGCGAPLRTGVGRLRHAAVRPLRARRMMLTKKVLRSLSSRYTAAQPLLMDHAWSGAHRGRSPCPYSPYGTQMFLTRTDRRRNSRPCACSSSYQSRRLPWLTHVGLRLPALSRSIMVLPSREPTYHSASTASC